MNRNQAIHPAGLLAAAGAGALLMYMLDPQQGRRRTALARDKVQHFAHKGSVVAGAAAEDLSHRATGLFARLRGSVSPARVSDDVLIGRVRSKLGRWVSHPHAIEVTAAAGCVRLAGPVLRNEHDRALRGLRSVRGVRRIDDQLDVHTTAEGVPALQGSSARSGPRAELLQENWSPGPRLATLAAGTALAWYGLTRHDAAGTLLGLAGAGLALRAATNKDLRTTLGMPHARHAVTIHKAIHIAAPRELVFDHWSKLENFPRFMSHVEEVRQLDETRSHWVVKGPAGTRVEWNAVTTQHQRPQVIAWCSEPDAPVQHAGEVHFEEHDGGTRVTVDMSYTPPGGALGHTLARLLRRDPKQEMDADLMRMKSFIETGIPAHDAAASNRSATPSAASSPVRDAI